jgi:hypothetical protein
LLGRPVITAGGEIITRGTTEIAGTPDAVNLTVLDVVDVTVLDVVDVTVLDVVDVTGLLIAWAVLCRRSFSQISPSKSVSSFRLSR